MLDRPSDLPSELAELGRGRRIVMHGRHSVVDWLCFAVWEDSRLVQSMSLSPDSGIIENLGDPLPFERPYWGGQHPVPVDPGSPDQSAYPLPFHPLELGEEALRALFGFVLEGRPDPRFRTPRVLRRGDDGQPGRLRRGVPAPALTVPVVGTPVRGRSPRTR
ncbi:hypothetical protein [Actinoplanes sp. N902-109]|uniref:DUF6928 family protein n=1 Tax=Actinoplanes sp. (strain N902-109) TaxID=649831 RepID=UPI000329457B|nr:hypothetical protein [Actinoplanes sp. N902-109]AGL17378.1 hypothetical protein L083_3868 [Actinoplanes sp. N902-109]